jgi:hypothetical membrane protein
VGRRRRYRPAVRATGTVRWPGRARRAELLLAAAVLFLVLTTAAMVAYPGGARYAPHSDGYRFFENFFSDLGATKTYSGRSNTVAHVFFLVALTCVGLAMIGFATTWRTVADRRGEGRRFGDVAQVAGIVSGIGFVGVAVTPWDRVLDAHNLFVQVAFGILLVFIVCLLALQVRNAWPSGYVGLNVVYLIVLALYVLVLFAGPGLDTKSGLEFQVAAQKLIVYSSIGNLAAQAAGIRREARSAAAAGTIRG